jgi:rhamnosyltransferase
MGSITNRASIKTLFLIKKRKVTHSPLRCYYMYRNLQYIEKKFKLENLSILKQRRKDIKLHLKTCFYYGGASFPLIRYLIKAYFDAKNNKMGKMKE